MRRLCRNCGKTTLYTPAVAVAAMEKRNSAEKPDAFACKLLFKGDSPQLRPTAVDYSASVQMLYSSFLSFVWWRRCRWVDVFGCRCGRFLAQVRFLPGDLRRKKSFCALWRRRSTPGSHTCARNPRHLRQQLRHLHQQPKTPAPAAETPTPATQDTCASD